MHTAPKKTVVISQPMFFPWVGMFEQFMLADVFVFYDDVQYSKGSFENRVQIKTAAGLKWLTVPVLYNHGFARLNDTRIDEQHRWRDRHLAFLEQQFRGAPFSKDALQIVNSVYAKRFASLAGLSIASMRAIFDYFGLAGEKLIANSSELAIAGKGSPRVLDIALHFGADRYVTGHGARNYLDHEAFEAAGVCVEYMDYARVPYRQRFGDFTASVSILDLIANEGAAGARVLEPRTASWREFLGR